MSPAAVSAPVTKTMQTDSTTGFALVQQPISLSATSPILADGTPLTSALASGQ